MYFCNFISTQLQILPVSSESYNDTEHSVKCSWSYPNISLSKVITGFRQKWRKVLACWKNGGGRECSWGRPDLAPQGYQGGEPGSWQQHHGFLWWGMEQQGQAHVNWWLDKSRYNEFHTNILAQWSDQILDLLLMYSLGTWIIQIVQFPCKFFLYQMFISCVKLIQSNWILVSHD